MNRNKLYVPNPPAWVSFFKKMADGNFSRLGGQRILSLDDTETSKQRPKESKIVLEMVSPAQQTVDQAKGELLRNKVDLRLLKTAARRRGKKTDSRVKVVAKRQQIGGKRVLKAPVLGQHVGMQLDKSGF